MIDTILSISITLFILAFVGYVLTILKEKLYLSNNMIYIDNKNLNPDDLENLDTKHFMLGSMEIMAGDEVRIILENEAKLVGTVLGASKLDNTIAIVTKERNVTNLNIKSIKKLKVISRYGKFFNKF